MTKLAGIIGHPVAHSLSPAFQGAAFRHCGLDVRYEAWETSPEALAGRLVSLRGPAFLGANVTIPYKQTVIPMLDELGGQSARVGAVNTIVNRNGRLFGFNTDGPGFVASLRREAHFDPAGAAVLLLGAGGAARGIAFALIEANVRSIAIANRTPERARLLASDLASNGGSVLAVALDDSLDRYGLIVNCTSVGMHGGGGESEMPCDLSTASPGAMVADIVYVPEETPLLRKARALGLRTLPGLPMLIYQGALAFELWTGASAPVEVMFDAARDALTQRAVPSAADAER
ncbi:MAG: shikimate dehydrogenase [Dehalococcoidia bacterium]|nr:shikimate dehydrogenase [Chloroflexi bacterium CFX7]MCK6564546.1 shikimate dehydrogenase [Dehalococcoidia bacterium]MCL4230341.1 shikimate dehydrogenase [Dehalococcoidia bacterium]NUQ54733.1 shikimate dehydrogenase [Dehalococcoidia bacterium]